MLLKLNRIHHLIKLAVLLATARAASKYQPEQIHLSLGIDSASEMVATWVTIKSPKGYEACVTYGFNETSLDDKRCGTSKLFIDNGTHQSQRWIHRVILTELQEDTRYYYQVSGSDTVYSFRTLRGGSSWAPNVLIFGDMGYENAVCSDSLLKEVKSDQYDLVIHAGDIAYDMDQEQGRVGDKYMNLIEPLAATIAYQVTMGNHENAYNFSHYQQRFTMYDQMTKSQENSYYSFNIGLMHVLVFSTEFYTYTEYGTEQITSQLNWIKSDLKEANSPENRRIRPWIITVSHKPFYCDEKRCFDEAKTLRKSLEKLFFENEVDVMFVGHEHKYQRTWPVYNGFVFNASYENPYFNPIAPVQIVTGSAGNREKLDPLEDLIPRHFMWRAKTIYEYSYTRLQVFNQTHLQVQQMSPQQVVLDQITLVKDERNDFYQSNKHNSLPHYIDRAAPQFEYKIW